MPIYEYRCINCNKTTEKICNTKLTDISCPDCGAKAERIVSLFSGQTDSTNAPSGCLPGSGFT